MHLTDPALADDPDAVLGAMLLRYGFTNVVDTGSELSDTLRLGADIAAGRVAGPRIVVAGGSLVYANGTPAYLPDVRLPEVTMPEQAPSLVNGFLDAGADGIKIFSGSFKSPTETVLLPPDVIRAITEAAHARGSFVIAHPTDRDGLVNAVRNGVDVLAHTAPPAGPLGPELIQTMLHSGVALIPTLKLWAWELARNGVPPPQVAAYQDAGVDQLREYFAAGGEILFGTDAFTRAFCNRFGVTPERLRARGNLDGLNLTQALVTGDVRAVELAAPCIRIGRACRLVRMAPPPFADARALASGTRADTTRRGLPPQRRTRCSSASRTIAAASAGVSQRCACSSSTLERTRST